MTEDALSAAWDKLDAVRGKHSLGDKGSRSEVMAAARAAMLAAVEALVGQHSSVGIEAVKARIQALGQGEST